MTHSFEHDSYNSDHILNDLEFTPEPLTLDEQELALLDLQKNFMKEWIDDPDGFMVRLIMQLDTDVTIDSPATRISPGLQFKDSALGVRTTERVLRVRRICLLPGNPPRIRPVDKIIPIASVTDGQRKLGRTFEASDADLIERQIEALRKLQSFCPNLTDDLMTVKTKELEGAWRSQAYITSRLDK